MDKLPAVLAMIEEQFTVSAEFMRDIATGFQQAMSAGLAGKPSSLKMLPSFIGSPTGREQGKVIAVDFGGTNVRVLLVELAGKGQANIIDKRSAPLKDRSGNYDYTSAAASGSELFDFIAGKISEIAPAGGTYPLGHTFSFPCRQDGVNEAVLISWTKEIKTTGVEGLNVGQLLQNALELRGVWHVQSLAVINDTTGTLLATAYTDTATSIGAICGTGHNSCYLEPCHPLTSQPMIVNLESGNFDGIRQTEYDILLDQASEKPGAQRLEKMASGQYLGELVRLIVNGLTTDGHISKSSDRLRIPYSVTTEDISPILADASPELNAVANLAATRWGIQGLTISELEAIKTAALLVTMRSARLAAATWAGVLFKIDPALSRRHTIAVDGSLYEKMPGYADNLFKAMAEIFGDKAKQVTIKLSKDGSGIGAAIAAATVYNAR
ncbi:hexokinase [Sporomusa sp.]|uniref:hexokinase family protein n=1 Tax=Sporomusa sp. TaxID=2078658 RepID=UPI002C72567A|nr:hexokinase [Sporomusa sp.]HWR43366.1 hexokinase [Sporomusa sp.]